MTGNSTEIRVSISDTKLGYFTLIGFCEFFQKFIVLIQHSVDTANMYSALIDQYCSSDTYQEMEYMIKQMSVQTDHLLIDIEGKLDLYMKEPREEGYTLSELGFESVNQMPIVENIFTMCCDHLSKSKEMLETVCSQLDKKYIVVKDMRIPEGSDKCKIYRSILFDIGRFVMCVEPHLLRMITTAEVSARQQINLTNQLLKETT